MYWRYEYCTFKGFTPIGRMLRDDSTVLDDGTAGWFVFGELMFFQLLPVEGKKGGLPSQEAQLRWT